MATDPTTNYGTCDVTWSYQEYTQGKEFSKYLRDCLRPGFYKGFTFSKLDDSTVTIAAGTALLNVGDDKLVHVRTSTSFNFTVTEATPVLYASFSWSDQVNNYPVYEWKAVGAGASTNQSCLGRVNFSGGNVDGTFDYTNRSRGLIDNSTNNIYCSGDIQGGVPIGTIVAWLPGYFADGSNGTYTGVAISLPDFWKECDGSEISAIDSPLLGGSSHYLLNLTDDRFLMGDISGSAGGIGGSNTQSVTQQPTFTIPNHNHQWYNFNAGAIHQTYDVNGTLTNITKALMSYLGITTASTADGLFADYYTGNAGGGACSQVNNVTIDSENRPKYLSVRYIIRIK
jgi:hypothetical protein